jgi:hemin uptake protein HemP
MDSARISQLSEQGVRNSVPRLDVRAVLQGCREVILVHRNEEYRLKLTSSGKLILTK